MSSGYAALAANRLTVPNDNSAFYFFSTVLLMDPDNAGAQRGLVSVRERYLQLLDDAVARQDTERAQALGTAARRAGIGADVVDKALAGLNAADQIDAALQSVAIVESGSRAAAGATVDPGRYDRNLSRALVRNGLAGSESRALNWVATGAQVQETTLALIDHYSAAAARDKLQGLHEQLLERASPLADLAAAHLQWQQGAPEAAVRQLQAVQLRGNAELARLRLLGGLLQTADDSAGAETVYTQLVRSPQAGAHDWLGLAVALDRQGKTDAARQTWQHLVNQQDLGPGLASFANRRLQALALTGGR